VKSIKFVHSETMEGHSSGDKTRELLHLVMCHKSECPREAKH
jgi:hypothetical protein